MDTKSSDDSLDKSLQQKCVVDDSKSESFNCEKSELANFADRVTATKTAATTTTTVIVDDATTQQRKPDTNPMCESVSISSFGSGGDTTTAICITSQSEPISSTSAGKIGKSISSGTSIETKVTQISKDLRETTLAESVEDVDDVTTSASSSSSSTLSTTPEAEEVQLQVDLLDDVTGVMNISASDSFDGDRSKKVRFHPDAKENDGGNRVKKKKLKHTDDGDGAVGGIECDMELDDDEDDFDDVEEDYEEEEEFDLAKTIAEAEDYLKQHPLTFVSPNEQKGERLKDGLLNIEDMPQLADSSEDEDFYTNVQPENGVQRVLGKQIKGGQVEFLLRYADRPGLFWETKDFIQQQCPSMLTLYERHREKRQERLMRHVAKRQNLRQRYTDF